ncbi:MAG: hypothetical protein Fur0025_02210 [Oscillatoriaceae cyanobacterium]
MGGVKQKPGFCGRNPVIFIRCRLGVGDWDVKKGIDYELIDFFGLSYPGSPAI